MLQIEQLILFLFYKMNGLRKRNAPYYILTGKKSGQTIQDVNYYGLHRFFYLFSKKELEGYSQYIEHCIQEGWIREEEGGWITVLVAPETFDHVEKRKWNGWRYERFGQEYFSRLSLAIQTLSYRHTKERNFTPIVPNLETQRFVSNWHKQYSLYAEQTATQMYRELHTLLEEAEMINNYFPIVFVERLTSQKVTGKTYSQLATRLKLNEFDVRLIGVEGMHWFLDRLFEQEQKYPLLYSFANGFQVKEQAVFLTKTAKQTYHLFQQGYTIKQIAKIRALKESTIQDHIVEIAYTSPNFPYDQFIDVEVLSRVREELRGKKNWTLKKIKEQYEQLSYFQIRLILTSQ